jgi:hypothetical protein
MIGLIITCDLSIWVLRPGNKAWTALNIISSIFWLTGFALVLYSRLHLIIPPSHKRVRQGILILIVVDTIAFHTPGIVATIIGAYGSQKLAYEISKHAIYIDIGYAGQDVLLSSVYIFYFWRYMHDSPIHLPRDVRKKLKTTLMLLLGAYLVVILTIVFSLVLLGKWLLLARYTMLPVVNVFNLQVEVFVLNKLAQTARLKNELLCRGNISEISRSSAACEITNIPEIVESIPCRSDSTIEDVEKHKGKSSWSTHDSLTPRVLEVQVATGAAGPSDINALEKQYLGRSSWLDG